MYSKPRKYCNFETKNSQRAHEVKTLELDTPDASERTGKA